MDYIHIKNLEKYHPQYKDRKLIWCKAYFSMINADPDFEMLCEIDRWRFLAFIMLELQIKKPIPLDEGYLARKGFELKKRPISLTLQMLHTLVEIRNETVPYIREDIEKNKKKTVVTQLPPTSDEDFIKDLKTNPVYKGINVNQELEKIDRWLAANPHRQKTRKFILRWLSKADKTLETKTIKEYLPPDPNCRTCKGTGKLLNGEGQIVMCKCVKLCPTA